MAIGDDASHQTAVGQCRTNHTGVAGGELRTSVEKMRHTGKAKINGESEFGARCLRMSGKKNDAGSMQAPQMCRVHLFRRQCQQQTP